MDRIIEVKVSGNHLSKDNKNAGVRGEANVTKLRIAFDEGWDNYAKKVTFWDAHGNNPVERTLTTDYIEDIVNDTRIYLIPIPAEPMAEAGTMTFVIDGYIEGKRQRSMSDVLEVKDAPIADNAGEPADPTPTQAEQLQAQIDNIIGEVQEAATARDIAEGYRDETREFSQEALRSAGVAEANAQIAIQSALESEKAIGKTSYIGENGNWFAWRWATDSFYDTGVKAQAGSTVYLGDNPPDEADVWIDPSGEADAKYETIAKEIQNLQKYYGDITVVPTSEDLFEFTINKGFGWAEITQCPNIEKIVIPYEYQGYPVGVVGGCNARPSVKEVVLPNTVLLIQSDAFSTTRLSHITLPNSVKTIKEYAFLSSSLKSITISNGINHIMENAFEYCTNLTDVYYEGTQEEWDMIMISSGNEALLNANIHYNYVPITRGEVDAKDKVIADDVAELDKHLKITQNYVNGLEEVVNAFKTEMYGITNFLETEVMNRPDSNSVYTTEEVDAKDEAIIEDINKLKAIVDVLYAKSLVKTVIISLPASAWIENSDKQYYQVVSIDGITEYSKVDLQPTTEQLLIFHEKDITFVTENEDGVVTVYCIGQKPMNDYTMQATVTEVEINE